MRISLQRIRISAFVATVAITFFSAHAASAAQYHVNNETDRNTVTSGTCTISFTLNNCSLRQAVLLANSNPGADTIFLSAGEHVFDHTLTTTGTEASIDDLNITDDLTIMHLGSETATIDANASGSDPSRIFSVENGATVSFSNMTLTGGYTVSHGGAVKIQDASYVTFDTVIIEGNYASGSGGGLHTFDSNITMQNSVLRNNTTASYGGGIYTRFQNDNEIILDTVLISENSASSDGGGIYARSLEDSGGMFITNTTITNNTAGYEGGGIVFNDVWAMYMYHSTVAGNIAQEEGGGLYVGDYDVSYVSRMRFKGNIIGENDSVLNVGEDCFVGGDEHITSEGYNVISDTSGCNESDFVGTDELNVDAELSSAGVADNGGSVETIALAASSPAVNIVPAGECESALGVSLTQDARGEERDSRCDAGAYEYPDSAPTLTLTGGAVELACRGTYTDPGYTATDDVDGTLTNAVVVDTSVINETENGTYTVTYTVEDGVAHATVATREVEVVGCTDRGPLDVRPITGVTPMSRGRVVVSYQNGDTATFTVFETGKKKPRARLTTTGDRVVVVKGNGRRVRVIDGYTGERLAGKKLRNKKQRIVKMRVFDYYKNADSTDEIVIATKRKNSDIMKVSVFTLHDTTDRLRKRSTALLGVNAASSGSEYTLSKKKKRLRVKHEGEMIFKARVTKNTKKLRVIPIVVPL